MLSEKTYKEAVHNYSDTLFKFLFHLTRNAELSDELIKDVYLDFWETKTTCEDVNMVLLQKCFTLLSNDIRRSNTTFTYATPQSFRKKDETHFNYKETVYKSFYNLLFVDKCILYLRDVLKFSYTQIGQVVKQDAFQVKQSLLNSRAKIAKDIQKIA